MLSALVAFTLNPFFAPVPQSELAEPTTAVSPTLAQSPSAEPMTLAQANDQSEVVYRNNAYAEVIQYHDVRPLPGSLDDIPVFNSNSPEVVQQNGILLSTFPKDDMASPDAHLDYAFEGRFDIFAHHIARGFNPDDRRTLFMGIVVYNPGEEPVDVEIHQAVSYLSQEAPFIELPEIKLNDHGTVFAGPGSRTTTDILRGFNQPHWPERITIPPGHVHLLVNAPIPLRQLTVPVNGSYPQGEIIPKPPVRSVSLTAASEQVGNNGENDRPRPAPQRPLPSNGRSALMYLTSSGPVHVASLAKYADRTATGNEQVPTLRDWLEILKQGNLAGPRDIPPSNPETYRFGRFYYGRVAGVAKGSNWRTALTDSPDTEVLSIPDPGNAFSYVLSSVDHNTLGTGQIQSAPMMVRYPDTAFRAHGNYGIRYSLRLPLYNDRGTEQTVEIKFQTPLQDEDLTDGLRFRRPPDNRIFFRGTVRLRFKNQMGLTQTHYVHVVQRRGQEGTSLLKLRIPPEARKDLEIDLIYPPDATPPHVLTVQNTAASEVFEADSPTLMPNPLRESDSSSDPEEVSGSALSRDTETLQNSENPENSEP
jgi:hypothetical protein